MSASLKVDTNMEAKEMHAKSFRNEDYCNRRVFLRSYPLHWGEEEEEAATQSWSQGKARRKVSSGQKKKHKSEIKPIKKLIIAVTEWSEGQVLILRRLKQKVAFYVVACIPVGFKNSTALISTK